MFIIGVQVGDGAPDGGDGTHQYETAGGLCRQRQRRGVNHLVAKDSTGGQQLPQAAHDEQSRAHTQTVVETVAEGRADRLQLSKFHALDNGRFHHQQRQINAQQ